MSDIAVPQPILDHFRNMGYMLIKLPPELGGGVVQEQCSQQKWPDWYTSQHGYPLVYSLSPTTVNYVIYPQDGSEFKELVHARRGWF